MASILSPVFLASASELLHRLEASAAPEARHLASEAREFTELFDDWLRHRPPDDVRVAAISRFFDLNRRANELLAREGPPSSGKAASPSSGRQQPSARGLPRLDTDDDDGDD